MPAFADDAEDDQKVVSFTLSPIPAALRQEFKTYTDYRMEPLNRMRDGSCVVTLTANNDTAVCCRFLGWLKATHDVPPALERIFCDARLGEWAEAWVKMLRDERGLKWCARACRARTPSRDAALAGSHRHLRRGSPQVYDRQLRERLFQHLHVRFHRARADGGSARG